MRRLVLACLLWAAICLGRGSSQLIAGGPGSALQFDSGRADIVEIRQHGLPLASSAHTVETWFQLGDLQQLSHQVISFSGARAAG